MSDARNKLTDLAERLNKLSLRERGLLLAVLLVILGVLGNVLVLGPLDQRQKDMKEEMARISTRTAEIDSRVQSLRHRTNVDPNLEQRQLLAKLRTDIEQIDRRLDQLLLNLVTPTEMPNLLETLLLRQKGLHLLRLENLGSSPLLVPSGQVQSEGAASEQGLLNVYRHTLRVEFEGSYLETLRYLEALQRMSGHLFWEALDIEIIDYPKCRVALKVHTLSLKEGWIGV